jgi:ferredoxin
MKTFYLTGTGNSLQIARGVSAGGELISIPRFLREHREAPERITISADTIGIVFPTYWLAVPTIVTTFLERVRLETDYLFAITTRGNTSLTLKSHLQQTLRKNGHALSYFNKVNMPDNYLPLFDMEKERLRYNELALAQQMQTMAKDIESKKRNVSGIAGLAFLRPFFLNYAAKSMRDFSEHFSVNESCTACGTCVRVCSAQSIKLVDSLPVHSSTCNYCLACAHHCPKGALQMNPQKNTARYRNPTVSTADIIAANS